MYHIINYTRINPDQGLHKKKSAYFAHPDFSAAKIEKKVRKLRKQVWYYKSVVEKHLFVVPSK